MSDSKKRDVVLWWYAGNFILAIPKIWESGEKSLTLNVGIFGNSGMYLWKLRGLFTLPTSLGRQRHKFKAQNM
jgi:hypothetical protein